MRELSQGARGISWLITDFVNNVPGVAHTVVVSSDGLPLAFSEGFPKDRADQLAGVASGVISLTQGAARVFEGGMVTRRHRDAARTSDDHVHQRWLLPRCARRARL